MATQSGIRILSSRYDENDLLKVLKDYKFLVLGLYPHSSGLGLAVVSFATKDFGSYTEEIYLEGDTSADLNLSPEKKVVMVNNVFNLDELREKLSEGSGKFKKFSHLLFKPRLTEKYSTYLIYDVLVEPAGVTSASATRPCPPDCPKPPFP
jgi:hypothetical protein